MLDSQPRFSRPDGQPIDPTPALRAVDPADSTIEQVNADAALHITADTAGSQWAGDTLDLSLATNDLMYERHLSERQRSAERSLDEPEHPAREVWSPPYD